MYIEERETPVMIQGVVIDAVTVVPDGCNAATGQGCEPGDGGVRTKSHFQWGV